MSSIGSPSPRGIALDQLIALNQEIASLIRAGVPLELGLAGRYQDMEGRLGEFTRRLAERMQQGATLPQALAAEEQFVPPVYRAIVEAGLRANRLPEALEALTRVADSLLDIRRQFALAVIHPVIVLLLAYGLGIGLLVELLPRLASMYFEFRLTIPAWFETAQKLGTTVSYWGPVVPVVILIAGIHSIWSVQRTALLGRTASGIPLQGIWNWVPGLRAIRTNFQYAVFTELLAILVEHQVPLQQAFQLAGDAVGDSQLSQTADDVVQRLQSGHSLKETLDAAPQLPSFLRWMMKAGEQQGSLVAALRQVHEVYHRRGLYLAERFNLMMPIFLIVGIGGTVTFGYALMLIVPMRDLLFKLSVD